MLNLTVLISEYLWIDSDYLMDIMNTCEDTTEKNESMEETALPSARCTQRLNADQATRKDMQGHKSNEETANVTGSEHIEIHEDIEDAEPTFYNERNVHLQLDESPSLSGTKDDEPDTPASDIQRQGRL